MTVAESWEEQRRLLQIPDNPQTRMAFQAGARHALSELIEHLDYGNAAETLANRLNEEIHAFGTAALKEKA